MRGKVAKNIRKEVNTRHPDLDDALYVTKTHVKGVMGETYESRQIMLGENCKRKKIKNVKTNYKFIKRYGLKEFMKLIAEQGYADN